MSKICLSLKEPALPLSTLIALLRQLEQKDSFHEAKSKALLLLRGELIIEEEKWMDYLLHFHQYQLVLGGVLVEENKE